MPPAFIVDVFHGIIQQQLDLSSEAEWSWSTSQNQDVYTLFAMMGWYLFMPSSVSLTLIFLFLLGSCCRVSEHHQSWHQQMLPWKISCTVHRKIYSSSSRTMPTHLRGYMQRSADYSSNVQVSTATWSYLYSFNGTVENIYFWKLPGGYLKIAYKISNVKNGTNLHFTWMFRNRSHQDGVVPLLYFLKRQWSGTGNALKH